MLKSAGSLSSLRTMERQSHPKSIVSSSDTDGDSASYASSSGTTTPEDEAQTFNLGSPLGGAALADGKAKCGPRGVKLVVDTKHRSLSSAVKKVKRVAHALAVFKKKRSDEDMSPILISSPLRERFGKRMSVRPHPDESFYSLPNRRFSFSDLGAPPRPHHAATITRKHGTISGPTSSFSKDVPRKQRSELRIPSFSGAQRGADAMPSSISAPVLLVDPETKRGGLTYSTVSVYALRAFLFLPWCAAVGGALLLFPSYVELVAFGPGYLPSPKGMRRFAHWAECGQQHVMIFLACLVAALWYNTAVGLALMSVAVSRFVYVWYDFKVDPGVPLGGDDQQSVYLVAMGIACADGSFWTSRQGGGPKSAVLERDNSAQTDAESET